MYVFTCLRPCLSLSVCLRLCCAFASACFALPPCLPASRSAASGCASNLSAGVVLPSCILVYSEALDDEAVAPPEPSGCKCKRSLCIKKYCECFARDLKCSAACTCENCHNGNPYM